MKGIDISKHNAGLKLADVKKAGYEFVILRGSVTGYGADRRKSKDTCFENFYQQAKKVGLLVGAYHYSCAKTYAEGEDEARFLYENCLKGKQFEMPIYIDVEELRWQSNDKKGVTDAILGFCNFLESKKYYAGVYSSLSWFGAKIDVARLNSLTKWVARWSIGANQKPQVAFSAFDMWQYTDSAKVGGKTVDSDICYRDFTKAIKNLGLNGFSGSLKPTNPSPEPQKTQPQAKAPETQTYTVKKGDTLSKIALKYHTTVDALAKKNGIKDKNRIYTGQVLKI